MRFEIRIDQNRLYPRIKIGIDRNIWNGIWQVQTSESNSMHEFSKSREFSVFICDSIYVWKELL